MKKAKVTVVGAGFVGATAAQRIVEKDLADVVLIDIVEGLPQGKALDMMESAPVEEFSSKILGTNRYEDTAGSDVIVITAGLARKPGMSRDDLLFKNAEIVGGIVDACAKHSPDAVIVMVTNPLDVMTWLAQKRSGFPAERVIGMAGELDSARYAYFISEKLGCKPGDVKAMVLGGHGDQMVPVPQETKVKGKPITKLLDTPAIETINQRTRDGGAEIVKLLKTGSAYYAPSSSAVKMVRAILKNTGETIPSCVYLKGSYGLADVYCGVPAKIGRGGVQKIVEISLTGQERQELHRSAEDVRQNFQKLKI
ncbi:MAG TPA: malate dehydrogenase [Candidatus Omnitrophota bacterium]|nr:malate dehydrogenase [Candidatus Omnitrophota bacterium]HRY85317.1 malate dehydrogenase [Candidatus Omnitrophota bacterium]